MLPQKRRQGIEIRNNFVVHNCEDLLMPCPVSRVFTCSQANKASKDPPGRSAAINVAHANKNKSKCLDFIVAILTYGIFNGRVVTIKDRLLLIGCLVFTSCATTKKNVDFKTQTLLLDTKVQIKDLRKGETQSAKIQVILLADQAIRMEVTALFGYAIASIVMTPDKIQYALHSSKKYVEGPFAATTLFPVFKQHIDPKILWNSVHNKNPASGNLKCKTDAIGLPLSCLDADGVNITWVHESATKRRIDIKNPQFEMIWVFKEQSVFSAPQNETFVLKKPEDYQQIQIR